MVVATIGALTGIVALCISVFTYRDNRRRTRVMEEQLTITRKEGQKKERYRELSKEANRLSLTIRQHCKYHLIEDLWIVHEKILTYMHDTHAETLRLAIEPERLEIATLKGDNTVVESASAFVQAIRGQGSVQGAFLRLRCMPRIFDDPQEILTVGGALYVATEIWHGCEELVSYRDIIDVLDLNILQDLDEGADDILRAAFNSLMSSRDIEFKSTDTSERIYQILKEAFEGGSFETEKKKLEDLCTRLANISKEMLSNL